jgi:PKD repeat protein
MPKLLKTALAVMSIVATAACSADPLTAPGISVVSPPGIQSSAGQQPIPAPFAHFSVTCNKKRVCSFDANGSWAYPGISQYVWEYGDKSPAVTSTSVRTNHTYRKGTYLVALTVVSSGQIVTQATAYQTLKIK